MLSDAAIPAAKPCEKSYDMTRPGDVRGTRRSEINSEKALWRIPVERMKMHRLTTGRYHGLKRMPDRMLSFAESAKAFDPLRTTGIARLQTSAVQSSAAKD
jgi:hypothetical protein